jgi:hypothetical protein
MNRKHNQLKDGCQEENEMPADASRSTANEPDFNRSEHLLASCPPFAGL